MCDKKQREFRMKEVMHIWKSVIASKQKRDDDWTPNPQHLPDTIVAFDNRHHIDDLLCCIDIEAFFSEDTIKKAYDFHKEKVRNEIMPEYVMSPGKDSDEDPESDFCDDEDDYNLNYFEVCKSDNVVRERVPLDQHCMPWKGKQKKGRSTPYFYIKGIGDVSARIVLFHHCVHRIDRLYSEDAQDSKYSVGIRMSCGRRSTCMNPAHMIPTFTHGKGNKFIKVCSETFSRFTWSDVEIPMSLLSGHEILDRSTRNTSVLSTKEFSFLFKKEWDRYVDCGREEGNVGVKRKKEHHCLERGRDKRRNLVDMEFYT